MKIRILVTILALIYGPAFAQNTVKLSDAQIAPIIVQESREAYYRTGHPCACPYDSARNGSRCGARSAYSRPGGASPKCYPDKDVTPADIAAYRAAHSR